MTSPLSHIGPSGLVPQLSPRPGDRVRIETCVACSRRSADSVHSVSRAGVVLTFGGFRFDRAGRDLVPGGSYWRLVGPEYDVPRPG